METTRNVLKTTQTVWHWNCDTLCACRSTHTIHRSLKSIASTVAKVARRSWCGFAASAAVFCPPCAAWLAASAFSSLAALSVRFGGSFCQRQKRAQKKKASALFAASALSALRLCLLHTANPRPTVLRVRVASTLLWHG